MFLRIIIGLAGMILGFFMVWRPAAFLSMIGPQIWMEKIFGPGREVSGYKLLGVVIIIVSIMIMLGLIEGVLMWFFSPIIPKQ
ncbi:MAG TPA: hypothetical protein PKL09_03635 [bacterium]|jgi:hypothetical protein|nr:hypothetical protein [bacterium]HNS34249.1 hypothetical protein [bacterium]HNZ73304.1 hypothetical protein [bacterium]HOH67419.1 hypothetical protein [bacterium]HPN81278.1 hypothetical protein [bacterium]